MWTAVGGQEQGADFRWRGWLAVSVEVWHMRMPVRRGTGGAVVQLGTGDGWGQG